MNRRLAAALITLACIVLIAPGLSGASAQQPNFESAAMALRERTKGLDEEKALLRRNLELLIQLSDRLPDGRSIFWTPDGRAAYFETGAAVPPDLLRGRTKPAKAPDSNELADFLKRLKSFQASSADHEADVKKLAQMQAEWKALCSQPGADRNVQGCRTVAR